MGSRLGTDRRCATAAYGLSNAACCGFRQKPPTLAGERLL
jgi:hypothetical protein